MAEPQKARRAIKVTEEQYEFLKGLKRVRWEPFHSVLQRLIDCYRRCSDRCGDGGAPG